MTSVEYMTCVVVEIGWKTEADVYVYKSTEFIHGEWRDLENWSEGDSFRQGSGAFTPRRTRRAPMGPNF